jgi:hypothetical protein
MSRGWALHDASPSRRAEPGGTVIVTYWRIRDPGGNVMACELYRTAAGFELRCGYGSDHLVGTERPSSPRAAEAIAALWKVAVLEKGFAVLPVPED